MKKIVFLLLISIVSIQIFAESSKVDSLISQLPKAKNAEKVRLLMVISNNYRDIDFKQAMSYAERANELALKLEDEENIAFSKKMLGILYYQKGDFKISTEYFLQALKYFKRIGSELQIGEIYINLASISNNMGEYEQTLEYYHKALELKAVEKKTKSYANLFLSLSAFHYGHSEYAQARKYALQSIELAQEKGYDRTLVRANNNLALIYIALNELEKAIELYVKNLKIAEENDYMMMLANTYSNMANVHYQLSDIKQARQDLQKAEKISEKLGNEFLLAKIYTNMAILELQDKKYDEALQLHQKGYDIRREIGSMPEIQNSLTNLGFVYLSKNELDKAEDYYKQSLELSKQLEDSWNIAHTYNNLADISIRKGELQKAWQFLQKTQTIAQDNNFSKVLRHNLLLSVKYYKKLKNYKKALEIYTEYEAVKDSLTAEKNVSEITSIRTKYEVDKKTKENEILRKTLQIQNLEKQFLYVLLVAAFLVMLFIVMYAISKIKLSKRLKKMNHNLRVANQTVESQKEEISLINKMLRHDLANNFVVIQTAIQLFWEDGDKKILREASVKCNNGLKLIRDLRQHEYKAVEMNKLDSIEITPLIDELKEEFSQLKIIYSGYGKVKADKKLYSVLRNLVENAEKHGKASVIKITVQDFSKFSEIRISDNGKGIAPEARKHIFKEKYSSGENANTGMGLYIAKSNILKWGGSIYAEENLPHGTTFVINLKKA